MKILVLLFLIAKGDDIICLFLYDMYQVADPKDAEPYLKRLVLQFLPIILWRYISSLHGPNRRTLMGMLISR